MPGPYLQTSLSRVASLPTVNIGPDDELRWAPKSPGTDEDYSLDVGIWADDAGEVVTSFTAAVSIGAGGASPLTCTAQPVFADTPNVLTVELVGGNSPQDCAIAFSISTATRTLALVVWITVMTLAAQGAGTTPAVIGTGSGVDPSVALQIAALEASVANLTTEIASLSAGGSASNTTLSALENEVANLQAALAALQAQVTSVGGSVTTAQTSIDNINNALANKSAEIAELLGALPFSGAGIPAGGFWITPDGTIQMAPQAAPAVPTNSNIAATLAVIGQI
jgi:flagellin-like hook-associated protein FlgL